MVLALLLWHCVTSIWDSNPWLVSHQFCSITSSAWMPLDSRGCAAHAVVRQHFIWWNCFSPPPPKCLTTGARRQPVRTARIMGGVESPVKTPSQGSPILLPSSRYFTSQCCVLIYNSESVYLIGDIKVGSCGALCKHRQVTVALRWHMTALYLYVDVVA